jgi:hypothetical protein
VFGYDDLVSMVLKTHASLNSSRRAERVARPSAGLRELRGDRVAGGDDAQVACRRRRRNTVWSSQAHEECVLSERSAVPGTTIHLEPAGIDVTPNPRPSLAGERCATLRSFAPAATQSPHRPPNVLGVSCAAGPACRSRSGAAVAANDARRTEWRTATAVTPPRLRQGRQLGCRAEAGPHQLHTKVSRPRVIKGCRRRSYPLATRYRQRRFEVYRQS